MKQETLEEAAENYNDKFQESGGSKPPHIKNKYIMNHFTEGAKWQADQDQEDINQLISIIEWYDNESDVRPDVEIFMWFEQFKKK